jgi:hypothetical protein
MAVALWWAAWTAWLTSPSLVRVCCCACEPVHWMKPVPSCQPVFHAPGPTETSPAEEL